MRTLNEWIFLQFVFGGTLSQTNKKFNFENCFFLLYVKQILKMNDLVSKRFILYEITIGRWFFLYLCKYIGYTKMSVKRNMIEGKSILVIYSTVHIIIYKLNNMIAEKIKFK